LETVVNPLGVDRVWCGATYTAVLTDVALVGCTWVCAAVQGL
jgi:hypothetical protein